MKPFPHSHKLPLYGALPLTYAFSPLYRIRNPLIGLSREELFADVEQFTQTYGLTDELELFKRGALAAQSPGAYETITELSTDEKEALHIEQTKRWSHPRMLYIMIILNSIAAAIQGWDQVCGSPRFFVFSTFQLVLWLFGGEQVWRGPATLASSRAAGGCGLASVNILYPPHAAPPHLKPYLISKLYPRDTNHL